ncbi:DEAD/DEAH box helicase, partial [Halobacillus sp. BBL2006]
MKVEKAQKLLSKLEEDDFVRSLVAQGDSKFLLLNVNEPIENFPSYTSDLEQKLTSIAISYLSIGCSFAENKHTQDSIFPLEKGATILENIYSSKDVTDKYNDYFMLVSSLAYYSAHQYSKSFVILKKVKFDSKINEIIGFMLKRQFSLLSKAITEILLNKDYSDESISENEEIDIANYKIYTVILSKSLALLLEFIFTGKVEYLKQTKE